MSLKIKPLNKFNVINGKWEILNKSYTDAFGSSHCNCRCQGCGKIKCLKRASINSYRCDCEK